ncbi:hypothetical protein EDB87DRAFT_1685912 [Lactarius vividus]|nr:hypothetical protein EDB87DRAFT_1685912 [Lactarius vividus]
MNGINSDLLPPPSPMSQYSYTGTDFPPEHLADVREALMDVGEDPDARLNADDFSDHGDVLAQDLLPNPRVTDASGLEYLSMILSELATITPSGNPRTKASYAAELVETLNTPAKHWDGLTALHWLGLNPLARLGAPLGYSGPSRPPSPSRPTTPLHTDELNKAVSNAVARSTLPLAQGMIALSVMDLHNRPPPPIPTPSPIRVRAPDAPPLLPPQIEEDSHMTPPPIPAAAPAITPALVSNPRAKKQKNAKPPTPAAAPPAKAPTPTPVTKPTPPPRASFASAVRLPARPSLVVTPRHTVGSSALAAVRRNPQELITHLNSVLLEGGHAVTLSAARWTAKHNLVLTAGPDTTAHHLNSASHSTSDALALFLSADASSPLPVLVWENCKWGRLTINGIPTGASLTRGPYSSSELHAALLADNPAYRTLRLTQAPSWVRAPTSYTPGSISSCVISFEDPSGDSLRGLMAGRTLFAFGHVGELKRWKAKPRGSGAKPPIPPSA